MKCCKELIAKVLFLWIVVDGSNLKTQSPLATLLSSLIAGQWIWLQTLWRFRLKDLSIDEMVGAWCFGCCQAHWGLPSENFNFNTRNKLLTQKLLKQGYPYHKLPKTFSKFYRRYYDSISKFQVGLKSLLRQGLWEPDFYGDLVYKLKKIVGSNNFSAQFIKIISHYKKIGYNINVLQQTACLVVNPITVGNFAFLFNCTPVGRTSDSMMVPT